MAPMGVEEGIDTSICVGCGLKINESTGVLEVQTKTNGGLACDPAASGGLYINAADSARIDITSGATFSADIIRSPDPCNGISLRANGLYAPCPHSITSSTSHLSPQSADLPFDATGVGSPDPSLFRFFSNIISVQNTTCCTVSGRITVQFGGIDANLEPGTLSNATLEVNPNGTGWIGTSPNCKKVVHNNHGSNTLWGDYNNMNESNLWVLSAGETQTYQAQAIVSVFLGGTAHLSGNATFEFQWDLNQTGCC